MSNLYHTVVTGMDDDVTMLSFDSSTPQPAVDVIRWQGPQPSCPALNALLTEASRPTKKPPKSDRRQYWDSPGPSSSTGASRFVGSGPGSRNSPSRSSKSRPTRPARDSPAPLLEEATPIIPFFKGSTAEFFSYLEGVREKADENTRRKILTRKQVTEGGRASRESRNPSGRVEKGQRRGREPVVAHRSLPNLSPPAVRLDRQFSMSVEVDAGLQTPMDVDVSVPIVPPPLSRISSKPSARAHMPPPPVPIPKRSNSVVAPETAHCSSNKGTKLPLATSNPLPIEVHPPIPISKRSNSSFMPDTAHLSNKPPLTTSNPPPTKVPPLHSSQSRSQLRSQQQTVQSSPPRPSQSSRPPVLGMRRTTAYSTLDRSQTTTTLPTKQKGFKPPLSRPPPPSPMSAPSSSSPSNRKEKEHARPNVSQPTPGSTPSPADGQDQAVARQMDDAEKSPSSPAPEADSSYGDISFDMDALEETMKLYD